MRMQSRPGELVLRFARARSVLNAGKFRAKRTVADESPGESEVVYQLR